MWSLEKAGYFKVFLIWTIFKVFIELLTILFLFHALVFCFWLWGMWDLSSPTRNQNCIPALAGAVLTSGPPRKSQAGCFKLPHFTHVLTTLHPRNVWPPPRHSVIFSVPFKIWVRDLFQKAFSSLCQIACYILPLLLQSVTAPEPLEIRVNKWMNT